LLSTGVIATPSLLRKIPWLSTRVKPSEFASRALTGKFVEMPMGRATVHELCETDNISAYAQISLKKIAQINGPYNREASISNQRGH
jgi:hypothetical protein